MKAVHPSSEKYRFSLVLGLVIEFGSWVSYRNGVVESYNRAGCRVIEGCVCESDLLNDDIMLKNTASSIKYHNNKMLSNKKYVPSCMYVDKEI